MTSTSTRTMADDEVRTDPPLAPRVIAIGHAQRREFRDLSLQLRAQSAAGWDGQFPTIAEALATQLTSTAELIVVWQSQPDEYARADVQQLLGAAPLASVVCVYGPWCESDGRTRSVWPASFRVPAWQADRRFVEELERFRAGQPRLPWTAAREDVWLRDLESTSVTSAKSPRLLADWRFVVTSPDHVYEQLLWDLLQETSGKILRPAELLDSGRTADSKTTNGEAVDGEAVCWLVDLDPGTPSQQLQWWQWQASFPVSVWVGLTNWLPVAQRDVGEQQNLEQGPQPVWNAVLSKLDPQGLVTELVGLLNSDQESAAIANPSVK